MMLNMIVSNDLQRHLAPKQCLINQLISMDKVTG